LCPSRFSKLLFADPSFKLGKLKLNVFKRYGLHKNPIHGIQQKNATDSNNSKEEMAMKPVPIYLQRKGFGRNYQRRVSFNLARLRGIRGACEYKVLSMYAREVCWKMTFEQRSLCCKMMPERKTDLLLDTGTKNWND
jgi:hypothetical protein